MEGLQLPIGASVQRKVPHGIFGWKKVILLPEYSTLDKTHFIFGSQMTHSTSSTRQPISQPRLGRSSRGSRAQPLDEGLVGGSH